MLTFSDDDALVELRTLPLGLQLKSQLLAFGNRRLAWHSLLVQHSPDHHALLVSCSHVLEKFSKINFDSGDSKELFHVGKLGIVAGFHI